MLGIYPRTKHGTISPSSILLSQEEHTPWWIGPSPSESDIYRVSTLPIPSHTQPTGIISTQHPAHDTLRARSSVFARGIVIELLLKQSP